MIEKFSHRRTLLFELDRISPHRRTLTWRQKICWCGWLGQVPQPRLGSSHWLGHLPSLPSPVALLLYKKKTSGTEISRTPDVKLRFVGMTFVGLRWFVGFNFGRVQLLRFIVVMVRSSLFSHVNNSLNVNLFSNLQ